MPVNSRFVGNRIVKIGSWCRALALNIGDRSHQFAGIFLMINVETILNIWTNYNVSMRSEVIAQILIFQITNIESMSKSNGWK